MQHTFEEYRRIFDGAIAKYEGQEFFAKLIEQHGRPAFPSAPRNVAIFGIRTAGKETDNRDNEADDIVWIAMACLRFTNIRARPNPAYSTR
jgi:hypothetical protein